MNGKFAIYSTRIEDYVVIDAHELEVAQIYAEKGVNVYPRTFFMRERIGAQIGA